MRARILWSAMSINESTEGLTVATGSAGRLDGDVPAEGGGEEADKRGREALGVVGGEEPGGAAIREGGEQAGHLLLGVGLGADALHVVPDHRRQRPPRS